MHTHRKVVSKSSLYLCLYVWFICIHTFSNCFRLPSFNYFHYKNWNICIRQGLWDTLYVKLQTRLTADSLSVVVPALVQGGLPRPRRAGADYQHIYVNILDMFSVHGVFICLSYVYKHSYDVTMVCLFISFFWTTYMYQLILNDYWTPCMLRIFNL